jgi:hypothetical protein
VRLVTERPGPTDREPAAVSAVGDVASPPDRHRAWTAEIEWRQTNAGAHFCVIARADDGAAEVTVAQSGPLPWPPTGPASVRALTDAAEKLEAALLASGWGPLPQGSTWYAKRFISEPSADSAASVALEPAGPARPVWVQQVGPGTPAQSEPTDPAPARWAPPVPSRPSRRPTGLRDGAGGEAARERPVARRTLPVAMVAVLVAAAAVTGLLIARAFGAGADAPTVSPAATPTTIAHGGLRLRLPSGWARADAATVPGFSRPLALRSAGTRLSALVERLPATSATLIPVALEKALPTVPEQREVVRLGSGQPAWRARVAQGSSSTVLYAAPTTSGVATVACTGPAGAGVLRGCDALAKAITVPGSHPLELGTSVAFYSRLPAVVSELETARRTGIRELSAAQSASAQAAAADGLVRAHKDAFAALAPLAGAGTGLPTGTAGALNAMAGAYAALAGAARARSAQHYEDARRAVAGADADLRRTLEQADAARRAAVQGHR